MGNSQGGQEGVQETIRSTISRMVPQRNERRRSVPLSSTWASIRTQEEDDDGDNGFILNGVYMPEVVLELMLSWTSPEDLLKLSQICRAWKDITTSRSFWRLVCLRNGVDWNAIPEDTKGKETAWMIFYAAVQNKILNKNFVKNHSGHERFENWVILRAGGNRLKIETPPVGIQPLPTHPMYNGLNDSAFVTSFEWCCQEQKVDLWKAGLTPAVMMTMVPFQFQCVEMIGSRFDCGGLYKVHLTLMNEQNENVEYKTTEGERHCGAGWEEVSLGLVVPEGKEDAVKKARFLTVQNDGKDNQFWAGHYGTKFSRISVYVRCLTTEEAEELLKKEREEREEEERQNREGLPDLFDSDEEDDIM